MFTNTITTGGVYIEATTSQKEKDAIREATKKAGLRAAQIEAELAAQKRARDAATAQANARENRFPALLLGMTRMSAKFRRTGDITKAEKLQDLADQMATALDAFRAAKKAESKPGLTPLADAVNAAATELRKALPKSFQTLADAEEYAIRYLPLTAARIAQGQENDRRVKAGKSTAITAAACWTLAGKAARIASGSVNDTAIAELELVGSL